MTPGPPGPPGPLPAPASAADLRIVERQLGRPPRGVQAIAHNCPCGLPDVVETAPRLPDGTPFPTLFYLTCPRAAAAISRQEAAGMMAEMTARLGQDARLRRAYRAAHDDYLARRAAVSRALGQQPLPASAGSAGGMPERVKCLHALAAHELAVPGANPLGQDSVRAAGVWWQAGPCVNEMTGPASGSARGDAVEEPASTPADQAGPRDQAVPRDQAGRRPPAGNRAGGIQRVAAIDCGTNSLRLLIGDIDPAGPALTDVVRRMEIVRLGQGVDATGRLAPEALDRTMRVLAEYRRSIRQADVTAIRMVATSATRDASNAADFTRGVVHTLGVRPEVISGDEEARLSFAGATTELAGAGPAEGQRDAERRDQPPYLVLDIGGGSTEFVLGSAAPRPGELAAISTSIGCVRLTERYLHGDPPTDAEIRAASSDIAAALDTAAAAVPVASARTLVGVAGSVTTVAAIGLGLQKYDPAKTHHAHLPVSLVHQVTSDLLSQTRQQRAAIGSLHPGRVDVIGAGALVLDQVMTRFGFTELVVSEHDILDGIAWSIAAGAR